jgi:hypothetical protein
MAPTWAVASCVSTRRKTSVAVAAVVAVVAVVAVEAAAIAGRSKT